jgi:hypothetical protein
MSSSRAVLWLVAAVVAFALLLYVAGLVKRALEKRARKLRYQRLGRETGPHRPLSQPGVLYGAMGQERAAAIRQDAEAAARLVASGQSSEPRNPHPQSSPEFVLWVATYHLTLADLHDEPPASSAGAWQPTPPESGASRP